MHEDGGRPAAYARLHRPDHCKLRSHLGGDARSSLALTAARIILDPEIRALPKGTALLLATGARPALIRTLPWYTGPRAKAITAAGIAAARPADEGSRR